MIVGIGLYIFIVIFLYTYIHMYINIQVESDGVKGLRARNDSTEEESLFGGYDLNRTVDTEGELLKMREVCIIFLDLLCPYMLKTIRFKWSI
jgi:hypothetical protein